MSQYRGRRSFVVRLLRSILRGMKIFLMAFAALGPPPPIQPPRGRDPTEQTVQAHPRAARKR